MRTYRRILLPIFSQGQSDVLLHKVTELAQRQHTRLLVVRVLDTGHMQADGPAAALPGEILSRRAPDIRKRLDLQLARNNLGWAETKVVWGEPQVVLSAVIRSWVPDLVVTCERQLPAAIAQGADVLNVAGGSIFERLSVAWRHFSFQHA